MKSFLTGSRVYGTPTEKSDVDMCVLLSYNEIKLLAQMQDAAAYSKSEVPKSISLRFGVLNLICTYDEACFAEWKMATEDLEKAKPVSKEEAVVHFKKIEAIRSVAKEPVYAAPAPLDTGDGGY